MKKIIGGILLFALLFLVSCGSGDSDDMDDQEVNKTDDNTNEDFSKLVKSNNELAFELLNRVEPDEDNNIFISPTSVMMALSMVYNGADGDTKDEIAKALHVDGIDIDELNQTNAELIESLTNRDQIQLNIANSIWVNNNFSLDKDFQTNTQDYFNAEVDEIDVADPKSAKQINQWVEDATENKITDMVDSPLDQSLVALLINAIYFKGDWKYEFDSERTEEHPFNITEDKTVDVSLMSMDDELNYMENDLVQGVELPYDGDMSMHLFLPKEDSSLDNLLDELTYDELQEWQDDFIETEGTLALPRFSLDYEVNLNNPLTDMGMASAFDKDKADFTKMIEGNDPLWIDKVKQKSFIEVNEEGTEAAAATSVEVKTTSLNPDEFQMIVDHPFLFTITDNDTGAILFVGAISNPPKIED